MKLSDIQPILNVPSLFISSIETIVIADLHIGIETELREYGLNLSNQTHILKNNLIRLLRGYNPKNIVLLGDIKHNIPSSTIRERKDVKDILEIINSYGTIHIVPGNHDGNIKNLIPDSAILHPSNGFVYENIGFVHGHRWSSVGLMRCYQLIIGHTHPTIMLSDRLGYKTYEPCWIRGKFIRSKLKERYPDSNNPSVLVMPAFNPLCGGIAVNKDGITGPFGRIIDVKNSLVYLLDGSLLGKVKDI
jgi:putative SbcD/Mre11-related phosphoesterase